MAKHSVTRSGSAPLTFEGDLISQASGRAYTDKRITRWHEIDLYRTRTGRYIVSIRFRCETRHDDPYDEAEVFDTAEQVVEFLEEYNPIERVRGWTLEKHAENDRRLRKALVNNFERIVSDVLADQPAFAESV